MTGIRCKVALLAILMALLAAHSGQAASWRVEQDGSGEFTSLQPAVDAAASGDTILVGPGWYQELHWITHYGRQIEVAANWDDERDLVFVGSGAETTIIGPETYSPVLDGPAGIYCQGPNNSSVSVLGIGFGNLYVGVAGLGDVTVVDCAFNTGDIGVYSRGGVSCSVRISSFTALDIACLFDLCDVVAVDSCTVDSNVYFGSTQSGTVRGCTATGSRGLAQFFRSNGLVEDCSAVCDTGDPVLAFNDHCTVTVRSNTITGGGANIYASDRTHLTLSGNRLSYPALYNVVLLYGSTLDASGNDILKSPGGDTFLVYCVGYTGQSAETISMGGNHWGPHSASNWLDYFIYDGNDDPDLKVFVDYMPIETESVDTEKKSLGDLKALYRGR